MSASIFEDKIYEAVDYTQVKFAVGAYEGCKFINCNFSEQQLANSHFTECVFENCNLSSAQLHHSSLNDVRFIQCKLLGVLFERCQETLFSVYFEKSVVNYSSFFQRNLKKTIFKDCILQEVDFTEADLKEAKFENCDLQGARFENCNLEKTDFRTSFNYTLNPTVNKLKKTRFSSDQVAGLLSQFDIIVD